MSESFRFFIPYHCNFCLRIISRIYFLHCCGIITINLQQYRSWLRQYGRRYVSEFSSGRGPLFHLQSAMRAGRESEANFCARSAVRHRVGRVAGGRSAIRNGICPLQTLLPRLFRPKSTTIRLYCPRRGGNRMPLPTSLSSLLPPSPSSSSSLSSSSSSSHRRAILSRTVEHKRLPAHAENSLKLFLPTYGP